MRAWFQTLDVFITFESPLLAVLSLSIEQGVSKSVLVLNVDWAVEKELRLLAARLPANFDFWVKGEIDFDVSSCITRAPGAQQLPPDAVALARSLSPRTLACLTTA